jgi:hypothetical protein
MTFDSTHKQTDHPAQGASENTWQPREGRAKLSARQAATILEHYIYDRQRKPQSGHVEAITEEMRRGKWIVGSQLAFGRLPDGSLHLVNGQHRLKAQCEAGVAIDYQTVIIDCPGGGDELHALYYRFDTLMRKRSARDVLKAAGVAGEHDLSADFSARTLNCGIWFWNGMRPCAASHIPAYLRTADGKLEALEPWWPSLKVYNDILIAARPEIAIGRKLMNTSMMAAAALTLRYSDEKARAFWSGAAANDGLRKGDPRRTFIISLGHRDLGAGSQGTGMAMAALAWNAWFEGRNLAIIKIHENHDIRFVGTPFDGRKRKG